MTLGRVLAGTALLGLTMVLTAAVTALVLYASPQDLLTALGVTGILLMFGSLFAAAELL